jgi:Tfp pilus assembly protein PilO
MDRLTEEQRLYIGIGVVIVVLSFGFWKYVADPLSKEIKRLERDKAEKERKLEADRREAARLTVVKAEAKKLKLELKFAEKVLPKKKDIPYLLVTLTRLCEEHNMPFTAFNPGNLAKKGDYSVLPITLSGIRGTYHGLARLLAAIGNLPRLINPVDLAINRATGGEEREITVSTNLKLESYIYQ